MKLPAYPRTKPSGVEWLGDVPEHWETTRFRFCVSGSNAGEVIDRSYWHSGDELLFSCQRESMISDFPDFPLRKRTTENDLLVTRNGTPYVHVPPANAIYSNVVQRCTLKDGPLRSFVALALETACERLRGDGYGVSIPSFSYEKWCDLSLPLPPPAEQRSIAVFLDRETGRVDRLVAKKRELIERLKEKRTALISRTVTRGLPPAAARAAGLPANPPLKPSALDWLGDIPVHWEVKKLGYGAYLQGGYAFASDKFDSEGVPVVRMNNLKRGVLDTSDASCVAPENCLDDFDLAEGDLLWGMSGSIGETGSLGNFARVRACDLPAQLNQRVGRFCVIGESVSLGFVTYVIQTKFFYDQILLRVTGTAQFNVSSEQVQSAKVPFPPLPEQAAIAAYLDEETAKLDALVGKVELAVERLQEYRTALITAAVTGKIDVRSAKQP